MNDEQQTNISNIVNTNIIETLRSDFKAREDLARYVKREIGFDIGPYIDQMLGEHPDRKQSINDYDIPYREIAENVYILIDEGFSVGQIASRFHLWPKQISRIVEDRSNVEKELKNTVIKEMPFYKRWIIKLLNI